MKRRLWRQRPGQRIHTGTDTMNNQSCSCNFPRFMRLRHDFPNPSLDDIAGVLQKELGKLDLSSRIKHDHTVAITAGSRGIANLPLIINTLVKELKILGARPFLVPAMGSHGGGTAQGQCQILEDMGLGQEYCQAPIKASMDVVQVDTTEQGLPVFFDRHAYEADHVAVVGRVKPHTMLYGEIETGLHKMLLIGLGKHRGAALYHQAFMTHSFDSIARSAGRRMIEKCGILLGLAIVENAREQTALVEAVAPEDFWQRENELLQLARQWSPRLPFDRADLLIVDEMGKNISGAGMDSNVLGRKRHLRYAPDGEPPRIKAIYVRDITEESHGNATGIGRAEFAHSRLVRKIDWPATYINCLTANLPGSAALPIHFGSDRRVLEAALGAVGAISAQDARVIRIKNTQNLSEVMASEAYLAEVEDREDLTIIRPPEPPEFDRNGDMPPL